MWRRYAICIKVSNLMSFVRKLPVFMYLSESTVALEQRLTDILDDSSNFLLLVIQHEF
jgi:hypothetical protein